MRGSTGVEGIGASEVGPDPLDSACVKHFGACECLIIKNLHLILVFGVLFPFCQHNSLYGLMVCACVFQCVCVRLMVIACPVCVSALNVCTSALFIYAV